jgi:pyruvate kinase
MRKFVDYHGGHAIKIISKIENSEGVENFEEILAASDGIMVARGDMGVEIPFERLPGLQKRFIHECYRAGKMVITATQMLESMISHANPTRAEITDVANAVFDGTSAVMLSGETAVGKYPLRAIEVMAKVAEQAERDVFEMKGYDQEYIIDYSDTTNAMCDAACTTAKDLQAHAIVALTMTGRSARRLSKFRPSTPIVAATPSTKTFNQLALSWGVYPVLAMSQSSFDSLFQHAIDCAKQIDLVSVGDKVVIVGGLPLDTPGNTNIIKVETIKSRM